MVNLSDEIISKYKELRKIFFKRVNPHLVVHRVNTWNYGSQEKNQVISLSLRDLFVMIDNALGIRNEIETIEKNNDDSQ